MWLITLSLTRYSIVSLTLAIYIILILQAEENIFSTVNKYAPNQGQIPFLLGLIVSALLTVHNTVILCGYLDQNLSPHF